MEFERPASRLRTVPIVPMIDILFIVLIFFIVSTTFKKPRKVLRIELPTVREVESQTIVEERSVLAVDSGGALSLDNVAIPDISLLDAYLSAYVSQNPGRKLELEADKELSLETLMEVWDALTRAGIEIRDVPARIRMPVTGPGGEADGADGDE